MLKNRVMRTNQEIRQEASVMLKGNWNVPVLVALVFGVIAMVFALLPLLSAWFMILTSLNYLIVPVGIICGIVAIIKSQNLVKSIVGLVLCLLAICLPLLLAEYYLESTVDSLDGMFDMINMLDSFE